MQKIKGFLLVAKRALLIFFMIQAFNSVSAAGGGGGGEGGWTPNATADTRDVLSMTQKVGGQILGVASFLGIVAYIAGVGFCLGGLVQFKAHKDNPQQVPLSKPIVYLVVGIGLLFLPSIMKTGGATIWGDGTTGAGGINSGMISGG